MSNDAYSQDLVYRRTYQRGNGGQGQWVTNGNGAAALVGRYYCASDTSVIRRRNGQCGCDRSSTAVAYTEQFNFHLLVTPQDCSSRLLC